MVCISNLLEMGTQLSDKPQRRKGCRLNKYGACRTGRYASGAEAQRAAALRAKESAGLISDLREQVPYMLVKGRRNAAGVMERSVRYIADFVYTDNATGETVVEDVKGVRTKEYVIKRKLMLAVHGITIREI